MYRIWVGRRLLELGLRLWLWVRLLISWGGWLWRIIDGLRILRTCLAESVGTRVEENEEDILYLIVAVGQILLAVYLLRRRIVGTADLRRCWGIAPLWIRCCHWSTTSHHLLLGPRLLLLLSLDGGSASFD